VRRGAKEKKAAKGDLFPDRFLNATRKAVGQKECSREIKMRFFGRRLCANFLSETSARWQFSREAVRMTRKLTGTSFFSSVASIDQSRNEKGPPLRERLAAGLSCPIKEHLNDTARAARRLSMSSLCRAGFSCQRGTGRDDPSQGIERGAAANRAR